MKTIIISILATLLMIPGAQARHMHRRAHPVECTLFCINLTPGQAQLAPAGRVIWAPQAHTSAHVARSAAERPRDCYGIAWCGCWLRHHFGLNDRSLNLARRWALVGHRTTPHAGAIVVWPHHVGVLKSEVDRNGRALVLSGNDGHAVRLRMRYVGGAIAFRDI